MLESIKHRAMRFAKMSFQGVRTCEQQLLNNERQLERPAPLKHGHAHLIIITHPVHPHRVHPTTLNPAPITIPLPPRRPANNIVLQVHPPIRALIRRQPPPRPPRRRDRCRHRVPPLSPRLLLLLVIIIIVIGSEGAVELALGRLDPAPARLLVELCACGVRVREFADGACSGARLVEWLVGDLRWMDRESTALVVEGEKTSGQTSLRPSSVETSTTSSFSVSLPSPASAFPFNIGVAVPDAEADDGFEGRGVPILFRTPPSMVTSPTSQKWTQWPHPRSIAAFTFVTNLQRGPGKKVSVGREGSQTE